MITVLACGRHLSVESSGAPHGRPVILLHGTPGSSHGPRPRSLVLHELGVRLITYDRPGYGGSDRLQLRQVSHAAADVAAIADQLGLERFAVVGRSGGGPHALACAALLPDRVTRVAAMVSLAPWNAPGLDWFDGMTESNVRAYQAAAVACDLPGGVEHRYLERDAVHKAHDPAALIPNLDSEMPEADRRIVADASIRRMLRSNFIRAVPTDKQLVTAMYGWLDDVLSFCRPWGFTVSAIARPILLWQGERDVFSPVGHFRWLADNITDVTAVLEPGAAHFGALQVLPHVLRWVVDDEQLSRMPA